MRLDAGKLAVGAGELADGAHVTARKNGGGGANVGSVLANVEIILIGEPVVAGGVHASLYHRGATGEDEHDVFAEFVEFALVAGAEAFS